MSFILEIFRFIYRRISLIIFLGRKHFLRSLFSSMGLLISLILVILILGILRPVKNIIVKKMEGSLPSTTIKVKSKDEGAANPLGMLNIFNKQTDRYLGIKGKDARILAAMPELENITYTQVLQTPAKANIKPVDAWKNIEMLRKMEFMPFDVLIQGVSPALVSTYLKCMGNFQTSTYTDNAGDTHPLVPLVVPETFAELFYVISLVLEQMPLNIKNMIGLNLQITLGKSILRETNRTPEIIYGKVCGFVPAGVVSAIGVPLNFVLQKHKEWGMNLARDSFDQILVDVKNPKDIETVRNKIASLGLIMPQKTKNFDELYTWLDRIDYIFWGIALVLLTLTAISLTNSFMLLAIEKKYEFGLYLVFGSSSFFIWLLMFLEGAFWGFLHSALAIYLSDFLFNKLQPMLGNMPWLSTMIGNEWMSIKIQISNAEKSAVIIGATLFAGLASLIPTIFMVGKKTLSLVKKD